MTTRDVYLKRSICTTNIDNTSLLAVLERFKCRNLSVKESSRTWTQRLMYQGCFINILQRNICLNMIALEVRPLESEEILAHSRLANTLLIMLQGDSICIRVVNLRVFFLGVFFDVKMLIVGCGRVNFYLTKIATCDISCEWQTLPIKS